MTYSAAVYRAFADEMQKIAASHGSMRVLSSRSGTRPIRVAKLLEKEKAGTLWKRTSFEGIPVEMQARRTVQADMSDLPTDVANPYRWEKLHAQRCVRRVHRRISEARVRR